MAKNTGTLVGAPIRINDDQDQYPAAYQSEIKGGLHYRAHQNELASFPAHLKVAGMLCFCANDGKTYQLKADLTTWEDFKPASTGGGSNNFASASWMSLFIPSSYYYPIIALEHRTENYSTAYAITFFKGSFTIDNLTTTASLKLGELALNARPESEIKEWFAVNGVEVYLRITPSGEVFIETKDGGNLPTGSNNIYYFSILFKPLYQTPIPYEYVRQEMFYKNDCPTGQTPATGHYLGRKYTSYISMAHAEYLAFEDLTFTTDFQAQANSMGSCVLPPQEYQAYNTVTVQRNNCGYGSHGLEDFTDTTGYSSWISQQDADDQAAADLANFTATVQQRANNEGTCYIIPQAQVQVVATEPAGGQSGGMNVFGLAVYADTAFELEVRIMVDVVYTDIDGYSPGYYQTELVLPAGETSVNDGLFPIQASPAESAPVINIGQTLPPNISIVKDSNLNYVEIYIYGQI